MIQTDGFTGLRYVPVVNPEDWTKLWADFEVEISSLSSDISSKLKDAFPNEFIIFEYGDSKCPAYHKNGVLKVL